MFRTLRFKLLAPLLFAAIVLFILINILIIRGYRDFYAQSVTARESRELILRAEELPDSVLFSKPGRAAQPFCKFLDQHLNQRITLIDSSGKVLGDSRVADTEVNNMENHRYRPEILMLTQKPYDYEIRFSRTLKLQMLYLAVPVIRKNAVRGYLRVAIPLTDIEDFLGVRERSVFMISFFFFIALVFLIYYFSGRIQRVISEIGALSRQVGQTTLSGKRYFGFSDETDRLYDFLDDSSERIQALIQDLVAQKEEIHALLQSVSEAVVAVDNRAKVIFTNDNACDMFGVAPITKMPADLPLIGLTHHAAFLELFEETVKALKPVVRMIDFRSTLRAYDLKVVCTPIENLRKPGELTVLFTLVDLTEEKKLARAKAEFVEAASHELRTPLTVLKGYTETLQEANSDALKQQCIDKISSSVLRLENLTADLLKLTSLESGKTSLKTAVFEFESEVKSILGDLNTTIVAKDIAVSVETDGKTLLTVPELMEIALHNLISNAVKYNRIHGQVVIRCHQSETQTIVQVLDSGIGIPLEFREKVFERFFRIDRHRSRETGGTGLGLAIVKHIAGVLKGSIHVIDGLEGGAGFELTLPKPQQPSPHKS